MSVRIPLIAVITSLAAAAAAQAAEPQLQPSTRTAASAERYGVAASYRTPTPGRGYSARDRHMADCLASYRGYDPRTDRVALRPGVTRRCAL